MSAMLANQASTYPPSQTALLLLDFHTLLASRAPPDSSLIPSAKHLLDTARQSPSPIGHSLLDFSTAPRETSVYAQRWETEFKPLRDRNPTAIEEVGDLKPSSSDEFVSGKRPGVISALKDVKFLSWLADKGVKSVVLAGISTSGAVMSTAREAADLGFVVSVVKEACWDPKQEMGDAALAAIEMTGKVVSLEEGVKLLGGAKE
ncbi:hypothetical protein VHEMI07769 [[Torrubiella] hemipterigena]|uniref:Isochorismatase-like domain-containing protein n=1 Tax=[Torrubiella] hemipterigena TaxID=1531966 RepID=A0A0A1T4I3_9HYPO|nr:hypothetical protein VHEMI07769 [[Torrubiella] hemipterigena]